MYKPDFVTFKAQMLTVEEEIPEQLPEE